MSSRTIPMARWALLAMAAVSLMAAGCTPEAKRDVEESFTHLEYYVHRDMRRTVALNPQKANPRAPDSLSVPLQGKERVRSRNWLDANAVNPLTYSEAAFGRGEATYNRYCTPCHGTSMKGDGPVAAKLIPAPDLLGPVVRGRSDGYIYSYIRNGGAVMPDYSERVSSTEAWEIVHFIREMQKRSPR